MEAIALFENAIIWLRENYATFQFFVERDVVWTLQKYLISQIKEQNLPYRVFNDFPILPGSRRSLCTDLAILNVNGSVEVAAELKYEPSHNRSDIWPTKFGPTVVFWSSDGVGKDIGRIKEFVTQEKTKVAYSVFIDENGFFSHKPPHPDSQWIHWDTSDASSHHVSILWSQVSVQITSKRKYENLSESKTEQNHEHL